MKILWLCSMQVREVLEQLHEIKDWGTPEWNENQNLLVLKIQGFDFLMQGFDFEIQGICSNINGNSRFWQSFDFVVEKKSKQKQNVNLLVLPRNSTN